MTKPTVAERRAAARAATDSLLAYTIHTGPFLDIARFHLLLIDHLEALERGDIDRLMINMPPRHGKSELTKRLAAYYLGRHPDDTVMVCSYGADLAYEISHAIRGQLNDESYPFPVRVAEGRAAVKRWGIENRRGGLVAAGVGGVITGFGANLLIIDDPVKDREQADSPTYRDRAWRWYRDTAYTRLMPGGKAVLIQTRWHQGDPSGLLIDSMQSSPDVDQWTVLVLPARAYETNEWPDFIPSEARVDPLGRQPGEALWPEWYGDAKLRRIEAAMSAGPEGPRGWQALYQQRPGAAEGNVFLRDWMNRRYKHFSELSIKRIGIFVDSAFKEGVSTSFSVVAVWAETEDSYALLDITRARVGFEPLLQMIRDAYETWRVNVPGVVPFVCIESKASGISALQVLEKSHLPVTPWPDPESPSEKKLATSSKEARADQATVPFKAGKILLPTSAPWIQEWIREHCEFPTATHNDQVDTTGMMVSRFYAVTQWAAAGETVPGDTYWQSRKGSAQRGGFSTGRLRGDDSYLRHFRRD